MAENEVTNTFASCTCASCGIGFYVPKSWQQKRREDHAQFWCPNGHSNFYPQETEAERLERELNRAKQRLAEKDDTIQWWADRANKTEKELRVTKGQVTKIKKRVSNGTCPCCNRSFANLHRHMKVKHPAFVAEEVRA